MKKLSIVTITYNAEKTLEQTLKSVNEQTYADIEHIIVDGNSSDKTLDLIRRFENDKMKWISEPDNGLYDAMNKGIRMATGDYICFLNAGDTFFAANTVETVMYSVNRATQLPDILYGETAIVDNKEGVSVGTTTFGKGLVQSVRELKDGTGYKLTTAQYFTPNGDYINGKGIKPTIEEKDVDKQLPAAIEWVKENIK